MFDHNQTAASELANDLSRMQMVDFVNVATSLDDARSKIRSEKINSVFIDPLNLKDQLDNKVLEFIAEVRREFPNIVFVLHTKWNSVLRTKYSKKAQSLQHFYKLDKESGAREFFADLETIIKRSTNYISTHKSSQILQFYQSSSTAASWIFGSILLLFLILIVFLLPNPTSFQKDTIRFLMALTGALFSIFFVGGVLLKGSLGGLAVSATGGFVLFILLQFMYDPFKERPIIPPQNYPSASPTLTVKETSETRFEFKSAVTDANGNTVEEISNKATYFTENLGNNTIIEMVDIPGGTFMMGTKPEDVQRFNLVEELQRYYPESCNRDLSNYPCKEEVAKWVLREQPAHPVTVNSFFIGKFEVTQKQWKEVARLPVVNIILNEDPSVHKGDNRPVETVSWREANEFCERLSRKTGRRYRLPTEAEWEYAARAGTQTQFPFGDNIQPGMANYRGWGQFGSAPRGIDRQTTVPVGSLGYANRFGLYDMTGNVWEWCLDRWHENYEGAPSDGKAWLEGGDREYRVVRGGSWWFIAYGCRSAYRNSREESQTSDNDKEGRPRGNHGFRIVLEK